MQRTTLHWLTGLCAVMIAATVHAADWPHWRGPSFDGSTDEKDLPVTFSKTQNVKWTADMPGPAAASPIVYGDKVFVSSTDVSTRTLVAICLDRNTGKQVWREQVGVGFKRDDRSNFASPSPATDGKVVIFFYGTGDLAGFSLDGKKLWQRNIQDDYGKFAFLWTFSSSPTIYKGTCYLPVMQRDTPVGGGPGGRSYLLALDPMTGKTTWRQERPSEAKSESLEAFTTAIPFKHGDREEIILAGGDCLTGHDPATGKELWRWGTWNPTRIGHWRLVPTPVAGGGAVVVAAPKGAPVYAIPAGKNGELGDSDILWTSEGRNEVSSDVATPSYAYGSLFVLNTDRRVLSRVDPKTGDIKWSQDKLGKRILRASPAVGDGKVYVMDHAGIVTVVNAESGEVMHQTTLGEDGDDDTMSSIAIAHGNLFIRTNGKLYCIGK